MLLFQNLSVKYGIKWPRRNLFIRTYTRGNLMLYWSYLVGRLLAYVCPPSLRQQRRSFSLAWRHLCVTPRSELPFHWKLPRCSANKSKSAADPRRMRQRAPETRSCEFSSYLNVITDIFLSEFWNRIPCKNGLSRPLFMTAMLSSHANRTIKAWFFRRSEGSRPLTFPESLKLKIRWTRALWRPSPR